jgi:hypothetical protein
MKDNIEYSYKIVPVDIAIDWELNNDINDVIEHLQALKRRGVTNIQLLADVYYDEAVYILYANHTNKIITRKK